MEEPAVSADSSCVGVEDAPAPAQPVQELRADSDATIGGGAAVAVAGIDSEPPMPPLPPVVQCTTIKISIRELNEVLACPLCSGYYRDAQTIPECLHSFCKVCIYKYLRDRDSREGHCPICLVSLGHSPHLKLLPDINIQAIVDKVFPRFQQEERRLRAEFDEREKAAAASEG